MNNEMLAEMIPAPTVVSILEAAEMLTERDPIDHNFTAQDASNSAAKSNSALHCGMNSNNGSDSVGLNESEELRTLMRRNYKLLIILDYIRFLLR